MRSEVIEFYKKHYVPKNMVLVMYTWRDDAAVECVLQEMLGKIANGTDGVPRTMVGECPYVPDIFSQILWIKSIRGNRKMRIRYMLADDCLDVEVSPHTYLIELLSYTGDGSLLHFLKKQGFAQSLYSSFTYDKNYGYGWFLIEMDLTEVGSRRYNEVISAVLAYIDIVKESPVKTETLVGI